MYKKYINKKYLAPTAVAVAALVSLAALVGYEKACQVQKAQDLTMQAKIQACKAHNKAQQQSDCRKLIKVDIQQPFAQRFPAYRHSKRVYNQVTPKKRAVRYKSSGNLDNLDSLALSSQAKPDTKTAKSEPKSIGTASSYNSPASNYNQSYNSPSSSMASSPAAARSPHHPAQHPPRLQASPSPGSYGGGHGQRSSAAPPAHEHMAHGHSSGSRTGQSRPAEHSMPEPVKKEAAKHSKPAAKSEENKKDKEKEPQREFNPSAAKPKPAKSAPAKQKHGEPTLEEILNNHGQLDPAMPISDEALSETEAQPSFSEKFKAGVQSLVELLVTVSMVKNGWDYVKQACDWLESTFGIGKWVKSLVGSGPEKSVLDQSSTVSDLAEGQDPVGSGPQASTVDQAAAQIPIESEAQVTPQDPVMLPAEAPAPVAPNIPN